VRVLSIYFGGNTGNKTNNSRTAAGLPVESCSHWRWEQVGTVGTDPSRAVWSAGHASRSRGAENPPHAKRVSRMLYGYSAMASTTSADSDRSNLLRRVSALADQLTQHPSFFENAAASHSVPSGVPGACRFAPFSSRAARPLPRFPVEDEHRLALPPF
jgi:hypothetical protein